MKSDYTRLLNNLFIIAVCFFVGLLAGAALAMWAGSFFEANSRSYYLAQTIAQNVVTFIGVALVAAWIISRRPFRFLGMTGRCEFRQFIGVVIVYIIALPALNQLIYYNEHITLPASMAGIEHMMKEWESSAAVVTDIILAPTDYGSLISGVLIIGCLTGLAEETLFRGLLQRTLEAYPGMKQWAIWIAAFLFSAVHMQFFGFFPRMLLGVFFGYILYTSGSIWPAAFAHAFNNSVVVVSAWLASKYHGSFESPETWGVSTTGFPLTACCSVILLILFFYYCYNYFFHSSENNLAAG